MRNRDFFVGQALGLFIVVFCLIITHPGPDTWQQEVGTGVAAFLGMLIYMLTARHFSDD